jgi:hypothetical protein
VFVPKGYKDKIVYVFDFEKRELSYTSGGTTKSKLAFYGNSTGNKADTLSFTVNKGEEVVIDNIEVFAVPSYVSAETTDLEDVYFNSGKTFVEFNSPLKSAKASIWQNGRKIFDCAVKVNGRVAEIEYKNLIFTEEDREIEIEKMKNKHFIVPNGVKEIGYNAFYNLNVSSVILSNTVNKIDNYAFASCYNLQKIDIPVSVKTLGEGAFNATGLIEINIPNSITEIQPYVFQSCYNLKSVTFSNYLTKIGEYAFSYCDNLNNIICNAKLAPEISQTSFYYVASLGTLTYPAGSDYSS